MTPNPSQIDRTSRVQRSDSLLSADMQGEVVIMDAQHGAYFSLDAIGTDIWNRLETEASVAELIAGLVQEYDAPAETIERDVIELLSDMAGRGLVVVA